MAEHSWYCLNELDKINKNKYRINTENELLLLYLFTLTTFFRDIIFYLQIYLLVIFEVNKRLLDKTSKIFKKFNFRNK